LRPGIGETDHARLSRKPLRDGHHAAVRIIFLVLGLFIFSNPVCGEVRYACNFEQGPGACGFHEQAKEPGRAALVKPGRSGGAGIRLRTEPGDSQVNGSGNWERNDLALSVAATACSEGEEAWWAHSVLFPDDYIAPPAGGGVVLDFHHTGSGGQANFHVDAMPNPVGLRLRGYGGARVNEGEYKVTLGPVKKNRWYDFVYHVKWSSERDGFMNAWLDGKKVLAYRGPTLYRGMSCYLKLANYHSPFGLPSSVIHDRVIRGTSAKAVALTPLEGVRSVAD